MAKFLEDSRHTVACGFEVIRLTEERGAQARASLQVDAPIQVRWSDWQYRTELEELRALYEKGKRSQWNASDDIDWSIPVSKDQWLGDPSLSLLAQMVKALGGDEATQKAAMFDELAFNISALLHGEQAALSLCGQLAAMCPSIDEKFYAANQANDEARHTEVMARLVGEKMGTVYPISPVAKTLLDELLSADTYYKKTLGMQTLFEGFAMGLLDRLRLGMTNPLVREVIRRVQLDEARHAAFGVLVMRRCMADASEREREELEDWAFDILEATNAEQGRTMLQVLGPKYGIEADRLVEYLQTSEPWRKTNTDLFMHTVIPNLRRLNLITERTEGRYRAARMLGERGAA